MFCLAGTHHSDLPAQVTRANPEEGVCWWCWVRGWTLVDPPQGRSNPWMVIEEGAA